MLTRHTNRRRYVFALLILTSITFITLDQRGDGAGVISPVRNTARDAVAPIDRAVGDGISPITDWFSGITQAGTLERDNAKLRRQLADLNGRIAQAQEAIRQNRQLSELNGITFVGDLKGVTGRVINGSPASFDSTLLIDRGSADGVRVDNPVITPGGLVGRIESVSEHTATIVLITDSDSAVGVRLVKSAAIGSAFGVTGRNQLRLLGIPAATTVTVGEVATTSGLDLARFPGGIPVGTVKKATKQPGELNQDVQLTPTADLAHLEFVRILDWVPTTETTTSTTTPVGG